MLYLIRQAVSMVMVALLTFTAAVPAYAEEGRSVHFVTDHEKDGGYLVAITRGAFERMGYSVRVTYLPWARALMLAMNGEAEALLGVYYNEERVLRLYYSEPIASSDVVFFKLKDTDIRYTELADLKPYRIGTIIGASYTPEFDAAGYLYKEPVSDYQTNIRKLLAGRVHLIVEKREVVVQAVRQNPEAAGRVVALDKPLKTALFYNAFSRRFPGHERKVADFNTGLKAMEADGSLAAIRARHLHE